jgi:hypothetical protein
LVFNSTSNKRSIKVCVRNGEELLISALLIKKREMSNKFAQLGWTGFKDFGIIVRIGIYGIRGILGSEF